MNIGLVFANAREAIACQSCSSWWGITFRNREILSRIVGKFLAYSSLFIVFIVLRAIEIDGQYSQLYRNIGPQTIRFFVHFPLIILMTIAVVKTIRYILFIRPIIADATHLPHRSQTVIYCSLLLAVFLWWLSSFLLGVTQSEGKALIPCILSLFLPWASSTTVVLLDVVDDTRKRVCFFFFFKGLSFSIVDAVFCV